jgi:hypothetical protein
MPVVTHMLFARPQQEITSLLRSRMNRCQSIRIVSGFATIEGVDALFGSSGINLTKLDCLVVGAGTYRAFEAFDQLRDSGVPPDRLWVHLGHTRATGETDKHTFYRYHPMLHSNVYLMEMNDGSLSVFVGSHNLTGFALHGLNGEAGVLVEGPPGAPELNLVRSHIQECVAQSVQYAPDIKDALSWWSLQFIEGLRDKANDAPRDGKSVRTIVILAVRADNPLPEKDDLIYFEIPSAFGRIESLRAEVHLYVFSGRPSSPGEGLRSLSSARQSLWCTTHGLKVEQGGVELLADWQVISRNDPRLERTKRPFRPTPSPGMQQVRVKVRNQVFRAYQYLFHSAKASWRPLYSAEETVRAPDEVRGRLESLKLIPPEDKEWQLVRGLEPAEPSGWSENYKKALQESSPESGGFILVSPRRIEHQGHET